MLCRKRTTNFSTVAPSVGEFYLAPYKELHTFIISVSSKLLLSQDAEEFLSWKDRSFSTVTRIRKSDKGCTGYTSPFNSLTCDGNSQTTTFHKYFDGRGAVPQSTIAISNYAPSQWRIRVEAKFLAHLVFQRHPRHLPRPTLTLPNRLRLKKLCNFRRDQ
mmetsp:Transcript_35267/g.52439  ORF Transcript_35267/g.52439 Transcript_35267/m.52439 type:complete len:160 (-) Transcript_35267:52-531(-)